MRVLVTGGAGFIGSHVVAGLVARGDETHVLDDLSRGRREHADGATLHVADVRDPLIPLAREIAPQAIVHLAAQPDVRVSVSDPALDADVNVIGTVRVLEAARAAGCPVVFASSGGAIYGECDRPAPEDADLRPLSPYGAAKLCGEEYLATFSRLTGAAHTALRYGNVYGPRQDPHGEAGVVAIFFGRIREGRPCTVFGDGSQTRDYVYAGDVAALTIAAMDAGIGGVVNVGTGCETSVVELATACAEVADAEPETVFEAPREGELARSVLDPTRLRATLGDTTTTLEDGLRATWEWIRKE